MKRRLIVFILCLIGVITTGCAGRRQLQPDEIPLAVLPTAQERTEARAFVAQQVKSQVYRPIPNGAGPARVRRVVERLEIAAGFPKRTLEVQVVDAGDEVNAVTINSATVLVYSKLLKRVPSDTDLAVVLSHEIGHAVGRHSQETGLQDRAQAVSIGSSILGTAASIATSLAGLSGASSSIGDLTSSATETIGYGAFVGAYDRDQEYEADHLGLLIMAKAGYDPDAAPRFWTRAEEIFGSSQNKLQAFFSTHPAPSDRTQALEEALPIARELYQKSKKA